MKRKCTTEMKIYFNNLNTHVCGFKNFIHESLRSLSEVWIWIIIIIFHDSMAMHSTTIKFWFVDKLFVRMILVVNSIKFLFFRLLARFLFHKSFSIILIEFPTSTSECSDSDIDMNEHMLLYIKRKSLFHLISLSLPFPHHQSIECAYVVSFWWFDIVLGTTWELKLSLML